MMCVMMMSMAVIACKVLATHSTVMAVVALIVAAIQAFKHSGSGGKESTSHVEIHPHHHSSRRVMQLGHMYSPHDMAYGMQRPDEPRKL